MALKFLNKKGWHTGSLRNIENVWKAEQKHEAEQKKLEELRKQIHEERERSEFRQLQEQAGLIPKQERLDFLYESGLAVGKGTSGFKALESLPKNDPENAACSSSVANSAAAAAAQQSAVPGALFEEKPQSANDAWRKLHSDPLLLIRRREQEALARVKNNPVQMAMIRKSVEAKKKDNEEEKQRKKHRKQQSKHRKRSSSKSDSDSEDTEFTGKKQSESYQKHKTHEESSYKEAQNSDEESRERDDRRKRYFDKQYKEEQSGGHKDTKYSSGRKRSKSHYELQHQEYSSERRQVKSNCDNQIDHPDPKHDKSDYARKTKKSHHDYELKERVLEKNSESYRDKQGHILERRSESHYDKQSLLKSSQPPRPNSNNRLQNSVKLSAEDRAARLREMQMDAEVHEEQRWKRLKKAAETDAQDALRDHASAGRNFLDTAQKSIYGAEKGGSSTIEESVRRRTHYSQGRSDSDKNAFRR